MLQHLILIDRTQMKVNFSSSRFPLQDHSGHRYCSLTISCSSSYRLQLSLTLFLNLSPNKVATSVFFLMLNIWKMIKIHQKFQILLKVLHSTAIGLVHSGFEWYPHGRAEPRFSHQRSAWGANMTCMNGHFRQTQGQAPNLKDQGRRKCLFNE